MSVSPLFNIDEKTLYREIAEYIRDARKDAELTQGQLALLVGVERTTITNIEGGKQGLPLQLLYRICTALDCEVFDALPSIYTVKRP